MEQLLIDLGVAKTYARPYTPNDNPYSESQFKTLKYRPDRFDGSTHAHQWAQAFFHWYNHEHHHTSLGLLTPAVVHSGQAPAVLAQRQQVLLAAYGAHPENSYRRGRYARVEKLAKFLGSRLKGGEESRFFML